MTTWRIWLRSTNTSRGASENCLSTVTFITLDVELGLLERIADETVNIARTLERTSVATHQTNLGYGGNQKTCYQLALDDGADIVIMVHPDYQYTPKLIPAMASRGCSAATIPFVPMMTGLQKGRSEGA